MIPLPTQEEFEALYASDLQGPQVIYFTASWCGPCRGIDKALIESSCKNVRMFLCDVDVNGYTPGYCGVRSIPSFLVLKPNAPSSASSASSVAKPKNITVGPYQNSKTADVISWIQANTS
jgi:thiol-disulfide isomerase/thioredoxin